MKLAVVLTAVYVTVRIFSCSSDGCRYLGLVELGFTVRVKISICSSICMSPLVTSADPHIHVLFVATPKLFSEWWL